MAARTPRTLGITAAAQLLGISVPLLIYRVKTGKVPVVRHRPILIRTAVLLDNLESLSSKQTGNGRPLGSCKSTKILQEVVS